MLPQAIISSCHKATHLTDGILDLLMHALYMSFQTMSLITCKVALVTFESPYSLVNSCLVCCQTTLLFKGAATLLTHVSLLGTMHVLLLGSAVFGSAMICDVGASARFIGAKDAFESWWFCARNPCIWCCSLAFG